jgi:hypothetical protein
MMRDKKKIETEKKQKTKNKKQKNPTENGLGVFICKLRLFDLYYT